MHINIGLQNEQDLIKAIDGKTFPQLSNNLKHILKEMFNDVDDTSVFTAYKADPRGKPDIIIVYKRIIHFVSVKSGADETIHSEEVTKFMAFLRENGISSKTQETFLLYQYGDGTTDGTGKVRYSYEELLPKISDRVGEANKELNYDKSFLVRAADRLLWRGNFLELPGADYIYHGNPEYGIICSKAQVEKHLRRKSFSFYHSLHIGPIHPRPYARYIDFSDPYPAKRNVVCFKWVRMIPDLNYISERYDG
jgi:hypothetical protein